MGFSDIFSFLNKFTGSRKAAYFDQLNDLTAKYQEALEKGEDTKAATLKKQLDLLRAKGNFTEGDL